MIRSIVVNNGEMGYGENRNIRHWTYFNAIYFDDLLEAIVPMVLEGILEDQ